MARLKPKKNKTYPRCSTKHAQDKIDWDKFDWLLEHWLRLEDIADFFNIGHDTIRRACLREKGENFESYADKKRVKMRILLMQKTIEKIKAGNNTMIIFGLKNMMDWHDNVKNQLEAPQGFTFKGV